MVFGTIKDIQLQIVIIMRGPFDKHNIWKERLTSFRMILTQKIKS